jgi:hypothetical protein
MKIKLRGHHLICLNFFKGDNYSKEFRDYLSELKENLNDREIELVYSIDDVCNKCCYLKKDICNYNKNAEDEIREMDSKAIEILDIRKRDIKWKEIKEKIPKIFNKWFSYCRACDWKEDCKKNNLWRALAEKNGF